MKAIEIYEPNAGGVCYSDIAKHLPTLRMLARGKILEIGVRGGCSTSALLLGVAERGGHVYSLDISECAGLFADDENWTFILGDSRNAEEVKRKLPIVLDMVFIDGDHSYEVVSKDVKNYAPLLRSGGVLAMHDVDLEGAGCRRALDEYAASIGKVPSYVSGDYGLGILIV